MQNKKWIRPITNDELNEALKRFLEFNPKGFWDVKCVFANNGDKCWISNDGECYYYWCKNDQSVSYFSFTEGKMEHAKGMYEVIYTLVCLAEPFVRLQGRPGRYEKILCNFSNYTRLKTSTDEIEEFVIYAGHPENIHRLERRIK